MRTRRDISRARRAFAAMFVFAITLHVSWLDGQLRMVTCVPCVRQTIVVNVGLGLCKSPYICVRMLYRAARPPATSKDRSLRQECTELPTMRGFGDTLIRDIAR